jgi:uncharacterized protein YndB with AHSA1/START domain
MLFFVECWKGLHLSSLSAGHQVITGVLMPDAHWSFAARNTTILISSDKPTSHSEYCMQVFKTSRAFAASPQEVFAALAVPERLARWWGPDGFRNSFHTFDFRPCGTWTFTMHGPDGSEYANASTFARIEADRRVVIVHQSQPHFTLTITLTPIADGTLVNWAQTFDDADIAKAIAHIVEPANEQNLTRWQTEVQRLG